MPDDPFGAEEHYILRNKGKSDAGINSGALLVVCKQNTADEGDIVVALVDNETTLKKFYVDNNTSEFNQRTR